MDWSRANVWPLSSALAVVVSMMILVACQTTSNVDCSKVDYIRYVPTADGCIAITILNRQSADEKPTMLVFLNGDQSGGGYKLDLSRVMEDVDAHYALLVEMSRPGYRNWRGDQSSGTAQYAGVAPVTEADHVAEAIRNLVDHYDVSRLVLMGHSGGAAYAGVITGRHAGLVDIAILHGCPCDYNQLSLSAYTVSMNPLIYADDIPTTTSVVAINGKEDEITPWRPVRYYINELKERKVPAKLVTVTGGHYFSSHWWDIEEVIDLALARDRTAFDVFMVGKSE